MRNGHQMNYIFRQTLWCQIGTIFQGVSHIENNFFTCHTTWLQYFGARNTFHMRHWILPSICRTLVFSSLSSSSCLSSSSGCGPNNLPGPSSKSSIWLDLPQQPKLRRVLWGSSLCLLLLQVIIKMVVAMDDDDTFDIILSWWNQRNRI